MIAAQSWKQGMAFQIKGGVFFPSDLDVLQGSVAGCLRERLPMRHLWGGLARRRAPTRPATRKAKGKKKRGTRWVGLFASWVGEGFGAQTLPADPIFPLINLHPHCPSTHQSHRRRQFPSASAERSIVPPTNPHQPPIFIRTNVEKQAAPAGERPGQTGVPRNGLVKLFHRRGEWYVCSASL